MKTLKAIARFLQVEILADIIGCWRASHKIRTKIERLAKEHLPDGDRRFTLPYGTIQEYFDKDQSRLRDLQDKARLSIIGSTLSLTIAFSGFGVITSDSIRPFLQFDAAYTIMLILLLAIGILFLIAASIISVHALRIRSFYFLDLDDLVDLQEGEQRNRQLILCLELNQRLITDVLNWVNSSYACIRNGMIAFLGFAFLFLSTPLILTSDHQTSVQTTTDSTGTTTTYDTVTSYPTFKTSTAPDTEESVHWRDTSEPPAHDSDSSRGAGTKR